MSKNGKYYRKALKRVADKTQRSLFTVGVVKSCNISTEKSDPELSVTEQVINDIIAECDQPRSSGPLVVDEQNCHTDCCELNSPTEQFQDDNITQSAPSLPVVSLPSPSTSVLEQLTPTQPLDSYDGRKALVMKYELKYPWVYHSPVKKGYICKYCEIFGHGLSSESTFVSTGAILGTHPSRRLDTHEKSARHIESLKRYEMCTSTDGMNQVKRSLMRAAARHNTESHEDIIRKNRNYITKLFKITLFLVKKKWGHTDNLRGMVGLVSDLGDQEVKEMMEDRINYTSSTVSSEIVQIMSDFYEDKVLTDLRGKKFMLFLDESTDNANRSQASLMARWYGDNGVTEQFLCLIHMNSTKAADFEDAISSFFTSKGIASADLRFVALDGCATMSGVKTGLQRRIRNLSPHSLYINCRNHRLALCFVHLVKNSDHLADVEGLLVSIWKLFHFSPKRNEVFKSIQDLYGEKTLTFVRASATRWLSHLRASVRFIARFECILDTLDTLIDSSRDPEIEGIRGKATNQKIVLTILLLTDILKPINYLSLYLQEDIGYFTNLPERVKACTTDLHSIIERYQGDDLQGLEFSKSDMLTEAIRERTSLARRARGDDQLVTPTNYLQTVGIPLIYDLIKEVEDAFTEQSSVLAAFSVLDPSTLPDTVAEINEYGTDKIHTLAKHYGGAQTDTFQDRNTIVPADLDPVVEQEMLAFRTHLFLMKQRGITTIAEVHNELKTDQGLRACFSRVKDLYELALLIPQSTAVVERSFSLMNDICTFLRSSLKTKNLDALMRLNCVDPQEGDFVKLVDKFRDYKPRQMPL